MNNKMLIRAETQKNEYFDFVELLDDIKSDKVIKYFLVVNDEEIEIPSNHGSWDIVFLWWVGAITSMEVAL